MDIDFGNNIKLLRENLLLTQNDLANIIGVKILSIARWESGKFIPSKRNKRKLIRLFKKYRILKSED